MEYKLEKYIEKIGGLKQYLSKKSKKELEQIFKYGEEMKVQGEKSKKEWRNNHNRDDFMSLMAYSRRCEDERKNGISCNDTTKGGTLFDKIFEMFKAKLGQGKKKYKYLNKMSEIEKNKFIEEYLYDDVLYSLKFEELDYGGKRTTYKTLKKGKVLMEEGLRIDFDGCYICDDDMKDISMKLKEGVTLDFQDHELGNEGARMIAENIELKRGVCLMLTLNEIGADGAEAIANMKLEECVDLYLDDNEIGAEGAESLSKMELKKGVCLDLRHCGIGDRGAKAISKIKLKEGVKLDLCNNQIGDEGLMAIAEKMELKEGVELSLRGNQIGDEGIEAIMENMELKEGVELDLSVNRISEDMKKRLEAWEKSYRDRGINCTVKV